VDGEAELEPERMMVATGRMVKLEGGVALVSSDGLLG
jgi:hypothetical protein